VKGGKGPRGRNPMVNIPLVCRSVVSGSPRDIQTLFALPSNVFAVSTITRNIERVTAETYYKGPTED